MTDKYGIIGPAYDALSFVFAGNSLLRCKCAMLTPEYLKRGDKVLFAGVGHGKEAIVAAKLGADVTVVDLSAAMLRKFKEGLDKEPGDLKIRIVHSDIMKVEEFGQYDMVVANFFLNVFSEDFMAEVLAHLIKLGKAKSLVVVGDFAFPTGNPLARLFKNVYWYIAIIIFWAMTGAALHPVYDYRKHMEKQGLKVTAVRHSKFLGVEAYTSLLGEKHG